MEEYYHVCTNGLAKGLWFENDDEYVCGMNAVPVCLQRYDVECLSFCLMSNHVHFILRGVRDKCVSFIRDYKRIRSLQIRGGRLLSGADPCIKAIDSEEYLKTAIAYVLRNPTAAGFPVLPTSYKWGSGSIYYTMSNSKCDISFGNMTIAMQRLITKSHAVLPKSYSAVDGMILPESYINKEEVERLYKSPKQFLYYLSANQDAKMELDTGIVSKAFYSDADLKESIHSLSSEMFGYRREGMIRIEEKYLLAREMRKRYGAGPKRLARVMLLDYDILKGLLL